MARSLNLILIMFAILILISYGQTRQAQNNSVENILELPIKNCKMESSNIHLFLSAFAYKYNIPVGLEVALNDDLNENKPIVINMQNGTVKDVLNSVIEQNPEYTWEVDNQVINIFPKQNRDLILKQFLEVKFSKFIVKNETSKFGLRESIAKSEEARKFLNNNNVSVENEVFTSRDITKLGRNFTLDIENVDIKSLLNQVIRNSQTRYWIVNRYGKNKEYLLLNL